MDAELHYRLIKICHEKNVPKLSVGHCIIITIATLEAIRAHQCANYPYRDGESQIIDEAIGLVKSYR